MFIISNHYDNAHAGSFMKTFKSEEVHLWEYLTLEDAQRSDLCSFNEGTLYLSSSGFYKIAVQSE